MPPRLLQLAASVIARASRELPADDVLRATLRSARGLMRDEGREVSRAVFAWFRWRGWLDDDEPLSAQVRRALDLAEGFALGEQGFSTGELRERAVPPWTAEVMDISPDWLRAIQREPKLWLRARAGRAAALARSLESVSATVGRPLTLLGDEPDGPRSEWRGDSTPVVAPAPVRGLPDALAYSGDEDLFRRPEFQAGEFEIQDIASQAVGLLCAPQPGETWWDACAGEGGKMLHLSDLMQNRGLIWATDRAEWRLEKLRQRAARARCFNFRTRVWDGSARLPFKTRFDGVLVDAPCSGVGTWGRNPHARWTTTPDDVRELAEQQAALLTHVTRAVKPGGRLVYAVCSLTRAECGALVDSLTATFWEFFEPLPLVNPFAPGFPPAPQLWLWPQNTDGNGMFVAAWRRR